MVQKVRYRVLTFFVPFVSTCFFLQHLQLQQSHDWPSLVFYLRTLLAFLQRRVLPLDLSMPLPYYMLREGKGRRFYWISFCNISPEPVDKAPRQANRPNRGPSRGRRGRGCEAETGPFTRIFFCYVIDHKGGQKSQANILLGGRKTTTVWSNKRPKFHLKVPS